MSANIFEKVTDCVFDTCKTVGKKLNIILGPNMLDFTKLFEEVGLCNKSKLYPRLYDYEFDEYCKSYIFKCPVGLSTHDFEKVLAQIAHFVGVDEKDIRIKRKGFDIEVKVITKVPKAEYDMETMKRRDFKIPLGYSMDTMELVYWDIVKNSNTHCYIAGSSGGGKSITLRLILCHLVNSKSKRDIEFSIINTKRVDLKEFEKCKHTRHYMTGSEGAEAFLEEELEEMERRYRLLEKHDCDDLTEYRKKVDRIPYRLIVVEEISSYKDNKEYQRAIELIASQGRGAGMILLLVTQLPSREIMPNTIKCNINTTIGLKTKDEIRSDIIVPDGELHKLKGDGHAKLFDSKHDGAEYQGLYISKETMKEIINNNLRQNKRAIEAGTSITQGDSTENDKSILSPQL